MKLSQETATLKAKVVVNATGAWVNRLRQEVATETVSGDHNEVVI